MTASIASLGFIIWFALSSSLKLPTRFQIMYDANPPYVNRILRRRILGTVIYGVVPLIIILFTGLLNHATLNDLGISLAWNNKVALWLAIAIPLVLIIHLISTGKTQSLKTYPDIRIRFWRPHIIFWSAVTWIIYLAAYEFFYRGLLLQSLLGFYNDEVLAIVISTGFYALTHYFRRNTKSVLAIIYNPIACYIAIDTGSILPLIIIHAVNALASEWLSIYHHPEMHVRKT